ncbi:MAG: ATP-binding protein [Clostridiales bacterium]|nr:ATP-binding protein [Clostridiales bacterium]
MKTITEAINERLARTRNEKQVEVQRTVDAVYRKHSKLRQIDEAMIDVRTSRLICSIEGDNEPLPALSKREEDILKEREQYLKDNNIRPNFDVPEAECGKCGDTGFTKASDGRRIVCTSCMKDALIEVYNESGMKDFNSYTLKGFDLDRFKDKGVRRRMFDNLRKLMEGKTDKSLMLLQGGSGTGKTYLAVAACKYAIMQGMSAYYIKSDRVAELKADELDELKTYDLIVIDDYAAEVTSYYKTAMALHTLLEARQAASKGTVIVSASALEVLVSDSDERIAGKLKSAGIL